MVNILNGLCCNVVSFCLWFWNTVVNEKVKFVDRGANLLCLVEDKVELKFGYVKIF